MDCFREELVRKVDKWVFFLRYGNTIPKSYLARLFGILWILIGLVPCSFFTAINYYYFTRVLTLSSIKENLHLDLRLQFLQTVTPMTRLWNILQMLMIILTSTKCTRHSWKIEKWKEFGGHIHCLILHAQHWWLSEGSEDVLRKSTLNWRCHQTRASYP